MIVRAERRRDRPAVRAVNAAAFAIAAEADLVDASRRQADPVVALVAEHRGEVAGHILFSPVTLDGHPRLQLMGLAPMAVAPAQQRRGVGSALGPGHPASYPRFGLRPAARVGIRSGYDAPEAAFTPVELAPDHRHGVSGTIRFLPAFRDL